MIKIGHRGARAYAPENTLESFKKAMEMGVDAIEFDVRKTKDDRLVVFHDADVKRTTNGRGLVADLTLSEIKELSTEEEEKIPTLEEALDCIGNDARVFIELKDYGIEEQTLKIVHSRKLDQNYVIISYLEDVLRKIRDLDKNIETGLIYARHPHPEKTAIDLKANYLVSFYRFTHTTNIEKAHKNGLKVIVWTINTKEEAEEYKKKGVDGIASDKPDVLSRL